MKVLILGGDGYLGWPTAMHLSAKGHEVAVVDNYFRRNICREENVDPLYEVPNMHQRSELWKAHSCYEITVFIVDLTKCDLI